MKTDVQTEKFFRRKSDGKIIFNAARSVGSDNAMDNSALHQRMAEHFYSGDGWPKSQPSSREVEGSFVIWGNLQRGN